MRTIIAFTLIAFAGCTDDPAPSGPGVTSHVTTYEFPARMPGALDLLFVVGDTANYDLGSLPTLVAEKLADIFHGFPDVRIATTSSDDVLELKTDVFGHHTQTFTGSLGDALATRLAPGDTDVLARMQGAVSFTREDAYLGVFTISAVDDTSADASYAANVEATKADPNDVIVSGIYKRPAPRLDAFLGEFPNRNTFTSIDSADLSPALEQLAQLQKTTLGVPCFEQTLDLDPNTPGNQVDCDVHAWDGETEISRIPMCGDADPTSGSCWEIVADPQTCLSPPGTRFNLRGEWSWFHPKVRLQCATL